jgi:hypothetical protein
MCIEPGRSYPGKPEGFQEFRSKTCARSAPVQHLDKCCEKSPEGLIECKECTKDKVISYKLERKNIKFPRRH